MRVPDLIEPFVAWRVWDVCVEGDRFLLESLFHSMTWYPGEPVRAGCTFYDCDAPGPAVRHATVQGAGLMPCGIYAGKDLKQAVGYLPPDFRDPTTMVFKRTRSVIGKVKMWGRVIEHEKGYRAEYAQPAALWVPISFGFPLSDRGAEPERIARALATAYEVPVKLFRRVSELEDV